MIDIIKRNRVFWEGTIGGKRLIERLKKRHGHFADEIVADALYLNAPFINTLKENGLEGCHINCVWCGIMSSGKKMEKKESVSCDL